MEQNVIVEPMGTELVLWRCLHGGPLTQDSIERWKEGDGMPWKALQERNVPLLRKLAKVYGAYAIVARDGERIVGQLRFYPKAVCALEGVAFCMQQQYPAGPRRDLVLKEFPPLDLLEDKTLVVHCMMVGSPKEHTNPYLHQGLGTRMARCLIEWARGRGWEAIEATAYEDLDIVYRVTGNTGARFWQKLGFLEASREVEPALAEHNEFVDAMRREAEEQGIDPDCVKYKHTMRLELVS